MRTEKAKLTNHAIKRVLRKLFKGEDYRIEIITRIDDAFLNFAVDFFKQIVDAKLKNRNVTADWYKKEFLDSSRSSGDIATNAGLNMKTIGNMYNSARKEIVIDTSNRYYDALYESILALTESEENLGLTLTLKFNDVGVSLNISETLVVINVLAVKRAAIRGGLWSSVGKGVEKPLMQTLCKLYQVPEQNYRADTRPTKKPQQEDGFFREVDFYLVKGNEDYKCEIKLMGKGNPESADAVIARQSRVFVADKLSDTNKAQLDKNKVEWVELRDKGGFQRFKTVLENLDIPHQDVNMKNIDANIEKAFAEIF